MESEQKSLIRVGSRKSELALIQTNYVINCLKKMYHDKEFEIVTMTTLGDRILDVSLPKIGEKSLFTKDLEDALRNNTVDFVVHSLKDLPTTLPDGLCVGAVFEREDPRDALVLREEFKDHTLATLPEGSVIGTSSLRRTAQLHGTHPHLKVVDVRGNLNTRLRKLDADDGQYAGLLLAKSGMTRMNWEHRITRALPCAEMMYAVGQGALAVECRSDNTDLMAMLAPFNHVETYCRVLAERSFLRTLGGGCSAPVGVSTTLKPLDTHFKFSIAGAVWSFDGKTKVHHRVEHVFPQIKKTSKHKLSPTEEGDNKKVRTDDETSLDKDHTGNPLQALDDMIAQGRGCEDTRTSEEIKNLKIEAKIFCGLSENYNIPLDVIERVEAIGKDLADELINNGALEVMKVTQDMIRSAVENKSS